MYANLQVERSSTVDRAVAEIRRALFAGELNPGTPLREVALSEAMAVSRSTVREALTVLVSEGLVVRVPNRGVAVKQLSAADVHDVTRARAALESAGVRNFAAAAVAERQRLRAMLAAYERTVGSSSDPAKLTEAHLQIHRALVGLTSSDRLLSAADALAAEIRLGLAHLDRTRANLRQQVREHVRLVDLVESGDRAAALAELHRHLRVAEDSLLDATGHATMRP